MKKRIFSVLITLTLVLTMMPIAEVDAASYLKTLNASVKQTSVTLKWNKLTAKQQKKVSGIAVFRDGKVIKRLGKKTTTFTNTGLKAGTTYTYQTKCYKVSKQKKWYNKKTKKWQVKKPAKKYRGKSKKFTVYKYSNASPVKKVTTTIPTEPTTVVDGTTASDEFKAPYFKSLSSTEYLQKPSICIRWDMPVRYASMIFVLYKNGVKIKEFGYSTDFYRDTDVDWGESYKYRIAAVRNGIEVSSEEEVATAIEEPQAAPTVEDGDWLDVSDAYDLLNEFRMSSENQWYWAKDSNDKVYLSDMYELVRDEQYENLAKARAKALWNKPNLNHEGVETAYSQIDWMGENLGWHYDYTARDQIFGKFETVGSTTYEGGWAETTENYNNQGHRRAMLTKKATKVGIACYQVYRYGHNEQCWVMVLGN